MTSIDLLEDAFERVRDAIHPAVNGLAPDELAFRPDSESNSIAWLAWHLTRIQDDHVAGLDGQEQVWTANGWADRFGLPFDVGDTGYGHDPDLVAEVRADAASLLGYFEDVHAKTLAFVRSLEEGDFSRVVDRHWDPPVTLSVRLMSVIADDLQHVGQAAYVRGILQRSGVEAQ
jgi:DinB superfamily